MTSNMVAIARRAEAQQCRSTEAAIRLRAASRKGTEQQAPAARATDRGGGNRGGS